VPEETVETAKSAYKAFAQRGVEGILDYLDPEIEWHPWSRFAREPNVVRGHDGVRQLFSVYEENFEDLRAEPLEFIEADDRIVVPFLLSGRQKGTGRTMEIELVHVWTTNGTQASRVQVYESKDDALRAVGLKDTD